MGITLISDGGMDAPKPSKTGMKEGLAAAESLVGQRYMSDGGRRQMKRSSDGPYRDDAAFTDALGTGRGRDWR